MRWTELTPGLGALYPSSHAWKSIEFILSTVSAPIQKLAPNSSFKMKHSFSCALSYIWLHMSVWILPTLNVSYSFTCQTNWDLLQRPQPSNTQDNAQNLIWGFSSSFVISANSSPVWQLSSWKYCSPLSTPLHLALRVGNDYVKLWSAHVCDYRMNWYERQARPFIALPFPLICLCFTAFSTLCH